MSVRVRCNRCLEPAVIQDSSEDSIDFKKLYCVCGKCGHGFVSHLTFSHSISPSTLDFPPEVIDRLKAMSRQEQQDMFTRLGGNGVT